MAFYVIYEKEEDTSGGGAAIAVSCGFNVWAALFRGFWALYHRLWGMGIALIAIDSCLNSLTFWLLWNEGIAAFLWVDVPLTLAVMILVGGFANGWRAQILIQKGWQARGAQEALSVRHALMRFREKPS
ncbi:MAG: DUF2628 domain-containing protein [Alphaproteobacteria bacterium GM202ARS2]|nr:DUF2628 domain-containing protein [Alphaproteobacteria bacterium GM202ARS2]